MDSRLTKDYLTIPTRLITEVRDNVIALALYCLVARLYLIAQTPVPLSRADILRYDPSLKTGAVKRALDVLKDARRAGEMTKEQKENLFGAAQYAKR